MSIKLFDTTLRDGTQREGVSLTTEDKIRIARELDALGLHYIEAGFPASNPKDLEFFEGFDASELKRARLVANTLALSTEVTLPWRPSAASKATLATRSTSSRV